ncbi:MAG: LLM class flavin-dependent oxidoreductase, partial [Caldilineae bacterium]
MKFSLRLNNDLPVQDYVRLAQAAEAAGFHQLWISNDLFLRSNLPIITAALQATSRLHVGAGILNPYTIHPAEMAMLAGTLDELSSNRFLLGVAAGAEEFLTWVGLEQDRPLTAMRETIQAVRRLLRGERASLAGRFLHWNEQAYLRFQPPRVTPIYLGAMGPRMLQLAGELADGALPLLFPPEHYFAVRPLLDAGVAQRAASLPDLDVAACIWVSLAEDREA